MPRWIRKSLVVLVTVLTFGLVTPPQSLLYDEVQAEKSPKRDLLESNLQEHNVSSDQIYQEQEEHTDKDHFIKQLLSDAETQSYVKFGERIKPIIEDEFRDVILPNIEKAIEEVTSQYEEEALRQLVISEFPAGGHSERIFNIADNGKNIDIIKFHVRKDHPPQSGYWFNFHYHTYHDDFQEHHHLGSIYWDKNTPPKWMS